MTFFDFLNAFYFVILNVCCMTFDFWILIAISSFSYDHHQMTPLLLQLHHPPPHPQVFLPSWTFQHPLSASLPAPLPSFSPPPSQPQFSLVLSNGPRHYP